MCAFDVWIMAVNCGETVQRDPLIPAYEVLRNVYSSRPNWAGVERSRGLPVDRPISSISGLGLAPGKIDPTVIKCRRRFEVL